MGPSRYFGISRGATELLYSPKMPIADNDREWDELGAVSSRSFVFFCFFLRNSWLSGLRHAYS